MVTDVLTMDQLTLIEAVHFLAFISMGALPRGTAPRDCPEALGVSFGTSTSLAAASAPPPPPARASSPLWLPPTTPRRPSTSRNVTQPVPRGTASIELKDKSTMPRLNLARPMLLFRNSKVFFRLEYK